MKFATDLHMHSALSPCADDEMTPNNIVNMALLKGLDIIAVSDHNSVENLEAVLNCSKGKNILVVPGMEVETREEVHVLCLFPDLDSALEINSMVRSLLPNIKNREEIFGSQIVMDEFDSVRYNEQRLLLTAADLSIEEIVYVVKNKGGAVIPAHVNRQGYSIISNLGTVPRELDIKYLEISKNCDAEKFMIEHPELSSYKLIRSSDAHRLGDILERENFIEIEDKSIEALLSELRDL